MTNKNSMGKTEYILANVFWSIVAMIWYRALLFIPCGNGTADDSKRFLWLLVVAAVTVGILFTFKKRRNYVATAINVVFPFQLYAAISYWDSFTAWIKTAVAAALILSFVFSAVVFFYKAKQHPHPALKKRIHHAILGARTITVVCLCIFIIPICINSFFNNKSYHIHYSDTVKDAETGTWTIIQNIETVSKIQPELWEKLSVEERLEVLSMLKNMELQYLGVTHEVYLSTDTLKENTLGCYIPAKQTILIDLTHLQNSPAESVVSTLVHECHHVYSWQQIQMYRTVPDKYKNMLLFRDASVYEQEYENYVSGNQDYTVYATQTCERHAKAYAKEAAARYYQAVLEHKSKGA